VLISAFFAQYFELDASLLNFMQAWRVLHMLFCSYQAMLANFCMDWRLCSGAGRRLSIKNDGHFHDSRFQTVF
jgi:hypothetical protein